MNNLQAKENRDSAILQPLVGEIAEKLNTLLFKN